MALSDRDIVCLLKNRTIIITPRIKDDQIGQASIDLTLSDTFWKFKKEYAKRTVDLEKVGFNDATEEIRADKLTLRPGELVLGITREKITLPPNIMGILEGRTRYARMGLAVHVTSSIVQPGSSNRQVLEIVNMAPFPIVLHAGMRISQIVFEKLETPTSKPYSRFGKAARRQ